MKYLFNILLLSFAISASLFADEEIESRELYLEYSSYPQRVFTGQNFEVELKALILKDINSYDKIITTFTEESNIHRLTNEIVWIKNKSSEYTTTITYKVFKKAFNLPQITLSFSKDEEIIDFISIISPDIKYEKIAVNQKIFSNIIAKDLEVFTAKTKQYTNNILHTTINIKAKNSNLEDFRLNAYGDDQGINSLTALSPTQNLYYYVMIPSHSKEIKFNYYNTNAKDFVLITIPIMLDEELISTQTELNPYNSSMLIYQEVFSGAFLLVSILLYIYRRNNIYLIFIIIFTLILTYLFMPNKKILLQKDIKVYILPTNNSTIFKTLKSKHIIEILNKKNDFVKVIFDNESIGWIKKDDI
tara:strand:- start:25 stop:1104 length:1080 start_codon:yes stop_codon:yes gene_type:complete